MSKIFLTLLILLPQLIIAQKWVDLDYQFTTKKDIQYGTAVDFAGNLETLKLDIAFPTNDTAPSCGRPLVIVIHGGAWMAGSKDDTEVQRLMEEFAQRGYVAVSPNYRLGLFQTSGSRNCNINLISPGSEWNCYNMQDTAEWYRAYYRAIQDVKGAIRYMVDQKDTYNLNPNNVFTTGFSAGGYNALGVAFLDHKSEWKSMAGKLADAKAPNNIYNAGCVKKYGWDTAISSMNLTRPSLGILDGDLNYPAKWNYKIKAAGNFYGGMFFNLLDSGTSQTAIYGFHQPNDLIVPYKKGRKVFHGYNACVYPVCNQGIINRPFSYSSPTIRDWAKVAGIDVQFDSTKNYTNCNGQIADPSKGGHQLDNWNRTIELAKYFANRIDTTDCITTSIQKPLPVSHFELYPNPSSHTVTVTSNYAIHYVDVRDLAGRRMNNTVFLQGLKAKVSLQELPSGIYIVYVTTAQGYGSQKLIVK
ncbi:MAG: T9SS type A sorting domain-containing protein [Bacteroidia bacterium]